MQYAADNLPGGSDLILHAEIPAFSWLQGFVTAYRLNINDPSASHSLGGWLAGNNTLVISGLRAKIAPVLWVDAQYIRAWILDAGSPASNFVLSNEVLVNLEVGYEFTH